jgi:hypothetical protein
MILNCTFPFLVLILPIVYPSSTLDSVYSRFFQIVSLLIHLRLNFCSLALHNSDLSSLRLLSFFKVTFLCLLKSCSNLGTVCMYVCCTSNASSFATFRFGGAGVVFDSDLSFKSHIYNICRSSFYHIRQLRQVRSPLDNNLLSYLLMLSSLLNLIIAILFSTIFSMSL